MTRRSRCPQVARRQQLANRLARGVATARTARAVWTTRPPLTVTAAATFDAHLAAEHGPEVDVLAPDELQEAATRAGIDLTSVSDADGAALQGFVSALRGAAGERFTLDGLADGTFPSPAGAARATLASHTQPGVDLTFFDAAERTVAGANVKITSSPEIVIRHFDRHYPDVPIVYAPADTVAKLGARGIHTVDPHQALDLADVPTVVSLGRTTPEFDAEIRNAIDGTVVDASTSLFELVPWFGFAAVGIRAMRRLAAGNPRKATGRTAAHEALVASGASLAAHGSTTVVGTAGPAVPAAIVGAWATQATLALRRDWSMMTASDRRLLTWLQRAARP